METYQGCREDAFRGATDLPLNQVYSSLSDERLRLEKVLLIVKIPNLDRGDAIDIGWVTQSHKAQIQRLQVDRVNNSRIFLQRCAKAFQEGSEERKSLKGQNFSFS